MPRYAGRVFFLLILILSSWGCAHRNRPENLGPMPATGLRDGVYRASVAHFPGRADVEVEIRDGRLLEVRMLLDRAFLGTEAGRVMPGRIVAAQSTDVDAVSGATGSSNIILEAVQAALDQARVGP
ncbi:MAG: FMN-binding protein [Pseudomonadota bacterium]